MWRSICCFKTEWYQRRSLYKGYWKNHLTTNYCFWSRLLVKHQHYYEPMLGIIGLEWTEKYVRGQKCDFWKSFLRLSVTVGDLTWCCPVLHGVFRCLRRLCFQINAVDEIGIAARLFPKVSNGFCFFVEQLAFCFVCSVVERCWRHQPTFAFK